MLTRTLTLTGMLTSALIAGGFALGTPSEAVACPDWRINGATFSRTGTDLWQPEHQRGIAGGRSWIAGCPLTNLQRRLSEKCFASTCYAGAAGY